jgi:tripartite-type tricarboxylate transporter receptor subunit TctC
VLVANPAFPVNNVRGLIDLAKAKPDTVTYAVSGTGGINHFAGALFARIAGVQLVNVPYKGGPQALTDLIGGQVQVMFGTAAITLGQVRAGRLKALGVSGAKRTPLLPEVPTIAESGAPGYEYASWIGMLAPAKTPPAVIARLNAEAIKAVNSPDMKTMLAQDASEIVGNTPEQFAAIIKTEIARWIAVNKVARIRAD